MRRTHLEALPPLERDKRVGEDAVWLVQIQVHLPRNKVEAVEVRLEPGYRVRSRYRAVRSGRSRPRFRQNFVSFPEANDVAKKLRPIPRVSGGKGGWGVKSVAFGGTTYAPTLSCSTEGTRRDRVWSG